MSQARRKFDAHYRAEAVQLVVQSGRPIAEIARELQINEGTLGNWVNIWRRDHPESDAEPGPEERARMAVLESENR
jgi:transposase-like protein